MILTYAAYGSNLHPVRLSRRLPTATLRGTAFVPDWSLRFHKRSLDGSGKCSIEEGSDGVHVAIYSMSEEDRARLDRIEGLGEGYGSVTLQVPGFGRCFSYTAAESHIDDSLQPYDWYRQLVLSGAEFHGFPRHYVERIRATQSTSDPDAERHQEMWDLVDLIEVQSLDLARQGVASPAE